MGATGVRPNWVKPVGGARKGAGRKVGAATQRSREIANRLMKSGKPTPLEVMCINMLYFFEKAEAAQKQLDALPPSQKDSQQGVLLEKKVVSNRIRSTEVAVEAAPYMHARIQAIELDDGNGGPLRIIFEKGDEKI